MVVSGLSLRSAAFFVLVWQSYLASGIVSIMSQKTANNDLKVAIWSVVVVIIALGAIIMVKIVTSNPTKTTNTSAVASPELMAKTTGISQSTFSTVAQGTSTKLPTALPSGTPPFTSDGKPEILYVGAEYCPYCATERWPMVIALSRFGSFTNLGLTTSSAADAYPSTATFSFHGSSYSSKYLVFTGVEETTNQPDGKGGYTALDTPTAAQQQLLDTYDAPPYVAATSKGSIPFIYFGGQFLITGSTYDPAVLQSKSQDQIASQLNDPTTAISKGAVGAANSITAAICTMTKNQPGSVCNDPMVKKIQSQLGK
jgi:thiol-disulfide isomerase/thioredoxin